MPVVPAAMRDEFEKPQSAHALLWLLELELDPGDEVNPPVVTRLVNHHQAVQWPKLDPGLTTWRPFPFTHGGLKSNSEGDLQFVDLSFDNAGLFLMPWLAATGGLEGCKVRLFVVSTNVLDLVYPNHVAAPKDGLELAVLSAGADAEAATIRIGDPNLLLPTSPFNRYNHRRCRHPFGSAQCGYVVNGFASHTTCSHLIEQCGERAEDMIARGMPPVNLGNFGAFPGLSRRRRG